MSKIYNQQTDLIEVVPQTLEVNGVNLFTSKMSEAQLNNEGWYNITYGSKPDRRYYSSVENKALVGNIYEVTYVATELPLATVQARMNSDLDEVLVKRLNAPIAQGDSPGNSGSNKKKKQQDDEYDTYYAKEDTVDGYTLIQECIDYEHHEYDCIDDEGNPTKCYVNLVLDWDYVEASTT